MEYFQNYVSYEFIFIELNFEYKIAIVNSRVIFDLLTPL